MRQPILAVDANPIFATLVRQTLEDTERYQVIHTARGEDAMEIARKGTVRLAIVDFDLPDLSGLELIRRLRAMRDDLVIIAVPIGGELSDADRVHLRIHDVLTKPFYLPDLVQRVDAALEGAPRGPILDIEPSAAAAPSPAPVVAPSQAAPAAEVPVLEPPPSPVPPAPPAWLSDPQRASRSLESALMSAEAAAGLLTRGGQAWSSAGALSPEQARFLVQLLAELTEKEHGRGALARFIRLPGADAEHMLYATAITPDIVLALLFDSGTPFGAIRRQAEAAARRLGESEHGDEETPPREAPPTPATARSKPSPDDSDRAAPDEWIPAREIPGPDVPFLDGFDVPPPDPGEAEAGTGQAEPASASPPIPSDWLPSGPRPASQLPFLDAAPAEPSALEGLEEPDGVLPEARYQLDFSAVLVPRFPEHRLTGRLAEDLKEWVARLCVAWGWRADAIEVMPDHLRIRISLAPEVVPSRAVHRLRQDLSARILAAYPGVGTDLPSGRFWARGYLLAAGTDLDEADILAFIAETRRSQGLPH